MFPHHLAQPPQQEAHTDARGAGEVELVAQSRREDKIIHVWRQSGAQARKKEFIFFLFRTEEILLGFASSVCEHL